MAVLQPTEYDIKYFDPKNPLNTSGLEHLAGYTKYSRVQYNQRSTRYVPTLEDSTGTIFGDLCKGMNIMVNNRFVGKKLLVLGCAYGFEVEQFRALGIDAWGIDVSAYAISQADPAVLPYLEVADARTKLATYKRNSWDFVFSRWFLECVSDTDLPQLISDMNFVCKSDQVHLFFPTATPPDWYNVKTIAEWQSLPFATGTILIANDDLVNYTTKIN